ncbi:MAG: hypothetical protein HYV93_15595 [Candidatus Rokubacteria bacterium]|nr:hypothetical protein [Candidatus Rokubacteria bacterium]
MRKLTGSALIVLAVVLLVPALAFAKTACATIPQGGIVNSAGEVIEPGYDQWGYNYQARIFNGLYCDSYRNAAWCQAYADVELQMKWNDAWLSNQDCTGDGLLDRHYGYPAYRGSGAWLTNHMRGVYEDNGARCEWTDFVKIVAAPTDAYLAGGIWHDASGAAIGPSIWGEFAVIQEVYNDPCGGYGGLLMKGVRPGLGNWENPLSVE